MRYQLKAVLILAIIALTQLNSPFAANATEKAAAKQKSNETPLSLKISPDGKAIVDQQGNEIARFKEGLQVTPAGTDRLPGCMRCWDECLIYDSNGNCIKYVRTCQWDFDCKQ